MMQLHIVREQFREANVGSEIAARDEVLPIILPSLLSMKSVFVCMLGMMQNGTESIGFVCASTVVRMRFVIWFRVLGEEVFF